MSSVAAGLLPLEVSLFLGYRRRSAQEIGPENYNRVEKARQLVGSAPFRVFFEEFYSLLTVAMDREQ